MTSRIAQTFCSTRAVQIVQRSTRPLVLIGVGALALAGCSDGSGGDDGTLTVVTTTSVYADVVQNVVRDVDGQAPEVQAVIDSPTQDPHSYEATPQDRMTVQGADVVVLNGGGYDAFMEDLAAEADVPVINAVEISGLEGAEDAQHHDHGSEEEGHEGHSHGMFNEHMWYDPLVIGKVSDAVAEKLGELDELNAQAYRDNAEEFTEQMNQLQQRVTQLELKGDYLATEPVANYLLDGAGLHNVTPPAFTIAVEDGTDAAPLVYDEVRTLLEDDVAVLVYNEQTSTGQSKDLKKIAEESQVPVLAFSETLPEGTSYVEWMEQNIGDLEAVNGLTSTRGDTSQ